MKLRHGWLWLLLLSACGPTRAAERDAPRVILVTLDGFRWQELFSGADEKLLTKNEGGVRNVDSLRRDFWRETPEERRRALLPFFWEVVATEGVIFGNAAKGSPARVTNGKNFSYPGYQELLCGFPDPKIDSNKKIPNPNVNVFEWLSRLPGFGGRVAAYCTWDVFPSILNAPRSGLPVVAGWESLEEESLRPHRPVLAGLPRIWEDNCQDVLTCHAALEHLRSRRPRALYVALGETDEWAHAGRYDLYLRAAHLNDAFLRNLWATVQSIPEYRGKTSLVVTTDHGRGNPPTDWKGHGGGIKGAEYIWVAVLGPRTPALGERKNMPEVTQSQVASTVAALAGEDYAGAFPQVGKVIPGAVEPR